MGALRAALAGVLCGGAASVHLRPQGPAWAAVPDANVTFSSQYCCNKTAGMANIVASIDALRFCFTHVALILDVPHGGTNARSERRRGGQGGYLEFLNSDWGKAMISDAQNASRAAVALLKEHCQFGKAPTWSVKVMDYDSPDMAKTLETDFGVRGRSAWTDEMRDNTMVYDAIWHIPNAQYVWHIDGDFRVYRPTEEPGPNFIERAVSLLRSDDRIMLASPVTTQWPYPRGSFPGAVHNSSLDDRRKGLYRGFFDRPMRNTTGAEVYHAKWKEGEPTVTLHRNLLQEGSSQQFLMDVRKAQTLLPFPTHTGFFESYMLTQSFRKHNVCQVWFDEKDTHIFAGPGVQG